MTEAAPAENPIAPAMQVGAEEVAEYKLWSEAVRAQLEAGEAPDTTAAPQIIGRLVEALNARVDAVVEASIQMALADEKAGARWQKKTETCGGEAAGNRLASDIRKITMPTVESFQDAAAARAAALLSATDPNLASASDLLFLSALLSAQQKFRASSMPPGDATLLLSMITADFEHWITRAANRAALVQAIATPSLGQLILADAAATNRILSNSAALAALAANRAAVNALVDFLPDLPDRPEVLAFLAGQDFFIERFMTDTPFRQAAFTRAVPAAVVSNAPALLAAIFSNTSVTVELMAANVIVNVARTSETFAAAMNTTAVTAMWNSSTAHGNFLSSPLMRERLKALNAFAATLSSPTWRSALFSNSDGLVFALAEDDNFLTALSGNESYRNAFWQSSAPNAITSVELATRVLSWQGNALASALVNVADNLGYNTNAAFKNAHIAYVLGASQPLATLVLGNNIAAGTLTNDLDVSFPGFYNGLVTSAAVLSAVLKNATLRQRLLGAALLRRRETLVATLTGDPERFSRAINNTTLSNIYGSSGNRYGRFTVSASGQGSAGVSSTQPDNASASPCIVLLTLGAATTTSTTYVNPYGLGNTNTGLYKAATGVTTPGGNIQLDTLLSANGYLFLAIGGAYVDAVSASSSAPAAARGDAWFAK
ncbi:MAG: hypothetical protein LBO79_04405 [Zoogloeaceae bacterium]|jgi:hypothetical protein|nr:hypothetical protein [Zoogloeaceae bacterium]